MDDGSKDGGLEIYFWFDLSNISSARGFIHDPREPRDACPSSSTLNGTWTGGSLPSARRALESNLPVNQTRLEEARRECIDGVPTSMTSSLEKARRGLVSSLKALSATLVIYLREQFFGAACRLKRFWKRCLVYSVVLEKVVLSRWCFVLWWTGSENVR